LLKTLGYVVTRCTKNWPGRKPKTSSERGWNEEIKALIPDAIAAVKAALHSERVDSQLAGVDRLGKLMAWAQGDTNESTDGRQYKFRGELTDLLILYRKVTGIEDAPAE
jgi:hypothetical protein